MICKREYQAGWGEYLVKQQNMRSQFLNVEKQINQRKSPSYAAQMINSIALEEAASLFCLS